MLKSQRQDALVALVNEVASLTVNEAAERLDVSPMTIRRDFEELSDAGVLVRVHGGARKIEKDSVSMLLRELTNVEKQNVHTPEKEQVARRAAKLICEGDNVFVGTGTTGEALARTLFGQRIRAITNSLPVFEILKDAQGVEALLIGGSYRETTGAFVGPMAERMAEAIGVDKAFIGVNGIYDGAISTSNSEEGSLQRLVMDRSRERYVIADASKVGRRDFFDFYRISDLDAIITDGTLGSEQLATLERETTVLTAFG